MIIHTLIKRGTNHKDFCEDFLLTLDLNEKYSIYAVFDGCSSGIESHFASALHGKALKSVCKNLTDLENYEMDNLFQDILFRLILQIDEVKYSLNLITDEILATANILLLDKELMQARIICIGDGFVNVNGKVYNFDQDNRPDYLAYNIEKANKREKFDKWYENFQQRIVVKKVTDVSIASDGIFSFIKESVVENAVELTEEQVADYLSVDKFLINNKAMLSRKCNILKSKHGMENFDDISMIRIVV